MCITCLCRFCCKGLCPFLRSKRHLSPCFVRCYSHDTHKPCLVCDKFHNVRAHKHLYISSRSHSFENYLKKLSAYDLIRIVGGKFHDP